MFVIVPPLRGPSAKIRNASDSFLGERLLTLTGHGVKPPCRPVLTYLFFLLAAPLDEACCFMMRCRSEGVRRSN